jgi:lipopolysaccharide transport system permease protein
MTVRELTAAPTPRLPWLRELWDYRDVVSILARKDFQVRYKRASFGLLWAVTLPLVQAVVFVVVFSRVGRFNHTAFSYAAYVLAGTLSWAYFSTTVQSASTSIVDGSSMTDKVWFPRGVLVIVLNLSNLFGLLASMVILLIAVPIVHAHFTARLLLIVPAVALLFLFTLACGLLTASLHVYFRDVKFLVQAGMVVLFYLTPIIYPATALHSIGPWLAINPMTGIVGLFQFAAAGNFGGLATPLLVSIPTTFVLLIAGLEAVRRHDRLFVDQL